MTILTVQLIVEFAKGLPAFIKIPQEDQITLLKVSENIQKYDLFWQNYVGDGDVPTEIDATMVSEVGGI